MKLNIISNDLSIWKFVKIEFIWEKQKEKSWKSYFWISLKKISDEIDIKQIINDEK